MGSKGGGGVGLRMLEHCVLPGDVLFGVGEPHPLKGVRSCEVYLLDLEHSSRGPLLPPTPPPAAPPLNCLLLSS